MSTAGAYLVTAHLPGYQCGSTLVGWPTPASRLWSLAAALARTLAAIHARGVVHCDVKPSNLLVRDHDVRIIDFGIDRYVGERCGDDGIVQCSRGWAAPEQLRTAPATPAVDVFAVTSWVVGPDIGGDYEWGAVFVVEDLKGYWEYLIHPVHFESEKEGLPLVDRFVSFDITGDGDPHINDRIAALHKRSYEENPQLAQLVADVPSFAAGAVPEDEPLS